MLYFNQTLHLFTSSLKILSFAEGQYIGAGRERKLERGRPNGGLLVISDHGYKECCRQDL